MKKLISILLGFTLITVFLACKKEKNISVSEEKILDISVISSDAQIKDEKNQLWHYGKKRIYVLFGYNFNDETFISNATNLLSTKYGLEENGGQIVPIIFPKNFRHGEKAVTVDLYNLLNEDITEIKGFITLGAPENTYKALAKIQDQWYGETPFPVISLFPQDETLGIEDTSIIVIDKLQTTEDEESLLSEETETKPIEDALEILDSVVNFMLCLDGRVAKDEKLGTYVKTMLSEKNIRRYADSDSGLYAINHFVIE